MTTNTLPPPAASMTTLPPPSAPRRCFICLNDQLPSDPPDTWVDPCPCTLEAHQDCMQSWVTDCERSNKPLRCPVCKSEIQLVAPFDPVLSISEAISRNFTRASPFILLTGSSMGMGMALEAYGIGALWAVAGREATWKFILGNNMLFDATKVGGVQKRSLVLMSAAPILLTNRLLPTLSMKLALPCVSFFTMYHAMHDPGFFTWPPSPQLALALLPYFRSVYFNIWRETILPYEVKLNRTLLGLPPLEETNNDNNAGNNEGAQNNRDNQRNMDGGLMGMLQGLLDVLDPDGDDDFEGEGGGELRLVQQEVNAGEAGGIELQLVIEEVEEQDEAAGAVEEDQQRDADAVEPQAAAEQAAGGEDQPPAFEDFVPIAQPPAANEAPDNNDFAAPPPDIALAPAAPENHEAPQAPPARRPSLSTVLLNISNALVGTLALPLMSFAAGELLRLALPRSWTAAPVGLHRTRGLMQQQWGRSLVGGSMYVVMRDVLRVYAKHRKVAAMGMRKVKNVERKRK